MSQNYNVSDVLLHSKSEVTESESEEKVILPITRYDNVMNAPHIITNADAYPGAPFHLYESDNIELSINDIRKLCGPLI